MNMARGMTTEARERAAWERNDREIRADISVWMSLTSKKVGDLAALVGISRATMYQRFREPETFSLGEIRKLYQVIGKAARIREERLPL